MRVQLNGETVVIPSSLSEITLKQRIEFQAQYGDQLDAMLKSILEIEDPDEKEIELTQFQIERMVRTVAFFLNTTVDALKESQSLDQIANLYYPNLSLLLEEENITPKYEFEWIDSKWHLHVPELKNGHKMTFGEFIDSKQIIQDLLGLSKNKWECLIPLCAIFLRKEGEEYQESFLYEDSDRLKLMETVPLDIAIQVGFFLSNSLNTFIKTSLSFHRPDLNIQEKI